MKLTLPLQNQFCMSEDMEHEEVNPVGKQWPVCRAKLTRNHETQSWKEEHNAIKPMLGEVFPNSARVNHVSDPATQHCRQWVNVVCFKILP